MYQKVQDLDLELKIVILDFLVHQIEHHDRPRTRVSKLVGQLMLRVGGVAGDDDSSGPQDAEVGDDRLRTVRETERHAIPFANSQCRKAASKSLNEGVAFVVGKGLAEKVKRRPARKPLRTPGEHLQERLGRKRKLAGNSLGIIEKRRLFGHGAPRLVQVGSSSYRHYHPPFERPEQGSNRLPYVTASDSKSRVMRPGDMVSRAQARRPPRNAGNPIP